MDARRYTLSEIDRIRAGIQQRNLAACPMLISRGMSAELIPESAVAYDRWKGMCEDQLRTALMAGVDPAEFPEIVLADIKSGDDK